MSKLEALGMPPDQAQFFAEQAQDYLIEGADILKDLASGDSEGAAASPGDTVATVTGSVRALLTGERVALNFLMHLLRRTDDQA